MAGSHQELIQHARQAFDDGDIARGGKIVHGILKREIHHAEAWSLLYTYLGKGKSFDVFQEDFVRVYYADQYELFLAKRAEMANGPFRKVSLIQRPSAGEAEGGESRLDFPRPKTGPAPKSRKIEKKKRSRFRLPRLFRKKDPSEKPPKVKAEKPSRSEKKAKEKQARPEKRFRLFSSKKKDAVRQDPADVDERIVQTVRVVQQQPATSAVEAPQLGKAAAPVRKADTGEADSDTGIGSPKPLTRPLGERSEIRLLIADDIQQTRENIRKLLLFEPTIEVVGIAASGLQAVELAAETQPDVILLDINMPDMDGLQALHRIREQVPLAQVIMLTVQDDPGYLREALQLGARDYLIKPPMIDDLLETVRQAAEIGRAERERLEIIAARAAVPTLEETTGRMRGHIVAVFSPKGGVGCTMLASNLAVALQATGQPTVLVDCNLQYGDIGLLFNHTSQTTIADLAPFAKELDYEVIQNAKLVHEDSGLSLLLGPNRLDQGQEINGRQIQAMIDFLANHFGYVILDTSSILDDMTVSVLEAADQVLMVTTQDIPSINDIRRMLDLAPNIGIEPDKIGLVLNQYHTRISITPEKISANLGREVVATIPLDRSTVVPSINLGKPFVGDNKVSATEVAQKVIELVAVVEAAYEESAAL